MTSVLYDAPGPRAKRRNVLFTIVFLVVLGLVIWWALSVMADKGQLAADKWDPFVTDSEMWSTYLLPGLWVTVKAAAFAIVIALPLGAILGIGRLSDHRWIRVPVGAVVEFFRAIPVLILMFFANAMFVQFADIESEIRPMYAVVTGLVLYNASVIAEIVRAGILSLPSGQTDAAKAIGMRKGQTMSYVLLPQAVTAMLPAIVSQLVVIVKDTALGGVMIGFTELLNTRTTIAANYANNVPSFVVVAVIFIVINFLITSFASWLEGRLRRSKRGTGVVLGKEDVEELNAAEVGGTFGTGAGGTI
jgi:glutamate transport system permease protein